MVTGQRRKAAEAVRMAADGGAVYASHVYLPFNLPGYATAAYEIFEQLGDRMPGAIILPSGQGGFLLGLVRGFEKLRIANISKENKPIVIGVQARACAPLWAMFTNSQIADGSVVENPTLAEGVRVPDPARKNAVLQAVLESRGAIVGVEEAEILSGRDAIARLGFYVEPTSAIVWSALRQTIQDLPDPIVVILTGSGYKNERN
jgi:threonine synthase